MALSPIPNIGSWGASLAMAMRGGTEIGDDESHCQSFVSVNERWKHVRYVHDIGLALDTSGAMRL